MPRRESIIQQEIVELLSVLAARYAFLFLSVPNEAFLSAIKTFKIADKVAFAIFAILKKMGLRPGASDLIIGHAGRMYCLEVKSEIGTQSEDQILFESWCVKCGIPYVVVRSVDEVFYWLKEWGIIPKVTK